MTLILCACARLLLLLLAVDVHVDFRGPVVRAGCQCDLASAAETCLLRANASTFIDDYDRAEIC